MTCFIELKRFWKWSGSISEVPLSPSPSSALRAPSPSREKVLLRFWEQWILQLRVNPACRMTWGWGESGRRNQFVKICRYKRHDKIFSCSRLSILINQKSSHPGFTVLESWRASKNWKGFGNDQGVSLKCLLLPPPSSALRASSPSREKVLLRFLKQWILQLRVNPSCRMTWGWGESGRRNQFIKICRYKRHE